MQDALVCLIGYALGALTSAALIFRKQRNDWRQAARDECQFPASWKRMG